MTARTQGTDISKDREGLSGDGNTRADVVKAQMADTHSPRPMSRRLFASNGVIDPE